MKQNSRPQQQRLPYQKPRVIYRDTLKTRAGSPLGSGPRSGPGSPFDPANLFGND